MRCGSELRCDAKICVVGERHWAGDGLTVDVDDEGSQNTSR